MTSLPMTTYESLSYDSNMTYHNNMFLCELGDTCISFGLYRKFSIITFATGSLFLPIQWDITVRCTPLSCCLPSWTAHMSLSLLSRITTCASPIHPRVVSAKRMTSALDVRDECYQH